MWTTWGAGKEQRLMLVQQLQQLGRRRSVAGPAVSQDCRSIATRPHGATSITLQITLADIWTTFPASSRPPASTAACPMMAAVATNWQIELRTLDSTQVVHSDVHAVQHDGNGTCMQSCTCTDRCTNVPPILSTTAAHKPNHYFSGSYAVRTQATSLQPLTVALYPQEGVVT